DAGARLDARSPGTRGRTPLACAAATASQGEANEPLIALLRRRGAVPNAADLCLGASARNAPQALRLLLAHVPDAAETASKAFASSISRGDTDGVRVLLEAGADPRRFRDDDGCPGSALHAAIASRCPVELFGCCWFTTPTRTRSMRMGARRIGPPPPRGAATLPSCCAPTAPVMT